MTAIDINQVPTEFNNTISCYPSITQAMVESHCGNLWANNLGAGLGCHRVADYVAAEDFPENQEIIAWRPLRSKILSL